MKSYQSEAKPFLEFDSHDVYTEEMNSRRGCKRCILITILVFLAIAIIFIAGLLLGRYTAPTSSLIKDEICANPPLLLVSLDGFWAGYLQRNYTPFINSIGREGVQAQYMKSSFPTKTFPNHFSIVTGLYPESHGIVDNHFYDRSLKEYFRIGSADQNDPKWWLGEPIWVTAVKNGLRTGVFYWPGSEVPIQGILPTYYFNYSSSTPFETRVTTILSWFDMHSDKRPQFMAMYFNEPDHSGHQAGPDSTAVNEALQRVDRTMKSLFAGLTMRGIRECVNIIIVSDHGMAASNMSKIVNLNDYIPSQFLSSINYTNTGVNAQILVNENDNSSNTIQEVYSNLLQNASAANAPIHVYLIDDLPARLHTAHFNKQRYGDIYVMGDDGAYTVTSPNNKPPLGVHGYDNDDVHMRAIFLAHGPAFKTGYSSSSFENVQVYDLLCTLLNIPPAANNGTVGHLKFLLK